MANGFFAKELRKRLLEAGFPPEVADHRINSLRNLIILESQKASRRTLPTAGDELVATIHSDARLSSLGPDSWRYTVEIKLFGSDLATDAHELNDEAKTRRILEHTSIHTKTTQKRVSTISPGEIMQAFLTGNKEGLLSYLDKIEATPVAWRHCIKYLEKAITKTQRVLQTHDLTADIKAQWEKDQANRHQILETVQNYYQQLPKAADSPAR